MHEQNILTFQREVYRLYKSLDRKLPWRKTTDPYKILVSEIMLQQTQAERVIPKYQEFLKRFSTIKSLASVPLSDVLSKWQGLGYNRRAKMLHECAQAVCRDHGGSIPKNYEMLKSLPGIGPYTAGAIMTFAYNRPVSMIETNIRTVFLHHFFYGRRNVSDGELMCLIEKTLDRTNPREWYSALMDYGMLLKKEVRNINRRSKHYVKQSRFEGSDRQIRGKIIRELLRQKPLTTQALCELIRKDGKRTQAQLLCLASEGLVKASGKRWVVA